MKFSSWPTITPSCAMGCTSAPGDKRHHRRADGVDDGGPGDQPNLPESRLYPGETVLEVNDLCHPTEFAHISFRLRKGKFSALRPGGRRTHRADAGALRRLAPSSGEIRLNGRTMRFRQPADAIRAGIVCVPEERQKQGRSSPCLSPRTSVCRSSASSTLTAS
jgi:hypothetical protein